MFPLRFTPSGRTRNSSDRHAVTLPLDPPQLGTVLRARITEQPRSQFDADRGFWQQSVASSYALVAYTVAGILITSLLHGSVDDTLLLLAGSLTPMALWWAHSAWLLRAGPSHTLELDDGAVRLDGQLVDLDELRVDWVQTPKGVEQALVLDTGSGPHAYATEQAGALARAYTEQGGVLSTLSDPFVRQVVPGVVAPVSTPGTLFALVGLLVVGLFAMVVGAMAFSSLNIAPVGNVAMLSSMAALSTIGVLRWRRGTWLTTGPRGLTHGDLQVPWTSLLSIAAGRTEHDTPLPTVVLQLVGGRVLQAAFTEETTRDDVLERLRQAHAHASSQGEHEVPASLRAMREPDVEVQPR